MHFTLEEGKSFEEHLSDKGYRKFNENYKKSDYIYWKSFKCDVDEDGDRTSGYSVGFAFYDFSKFPNHTTDKKIGVSYECMISDHAGVDRVDMTITDNNTTIEEFESICKNFHEFFISMHRLKTARNN